MDAIWQGLSGIFEVALIAGLGFFLAKKAAAHDPFAVCQFHA